MKNVLIAIAFAFVGTTQAAPSTFITEPENHGTQQERINAVVGCMQDETVQPYVTQKVQLEDEYNKEVEATYHSLLKQGHSRVTARKSAEAILFELGEKAKGAQERMDNALGGCTKLKYNIDLK